MGRFAFPTFILSLLFATHPILAVGKHYALVVGVKRYQPRQPLPELSYTENDANDLAKVLTDGGYQVTLMTQAVGRVEGKESLAPISDFIRDELEAMLENPFLNENDVVLVALAGHGVQFELTEGTKKTSKFYFCPSDADISRLKSANEITDRNRLIDLSELYNALNKSKAGGKLLLVDACRNDPSKPSPSRSTASSTLPALPPPPGGTAAFFSCSAHQQAFEDKDLKHGVFFHHVIEALNGDADAGTVKRPPDGQITLAELSEYVASSTYDFVRDKYAGARQAPELKGEFRLSIPLIRATTTAPIATPVPTSIATRSPSVDSKFLTNPEGKRAGETRILNPELALKLVWCPPGVFTMYEQGDSENENAKSQLKAKQFFEEKSKSKIGDKGKCNSDDTEDSTGDSELNLDCQEKREPTDAEELTSRPRTDAENLTAIPEAIAASPLQQYPSQVKPDNNVSRKGPLSTSKVAPKTQADLLDKGEIEYRKGFERREKAALSEKESLTVSAYEVTLTRGFWLGETEVTQRQWIQVMGTEPWIEHSAETKEEFLPADDAPAVFICHGDTGSGTLLADSATLFCQKLTEQERRGRRLPSGWKYVLPTEAQWEYACRAGTRTNYSFGENPTRLSDYAWWVGTGSKSHQAAQTVGQKQANAWGLKDMHGNVSELCSNWLDTSKIDFGGKLGVASNPQGPSYGELHLHRGGAWNSEATNCQSFSRAACTPSFRSNALGFRIALVSGRIERSVEPTESLESSPSQKEIFSKEKSAR